MPGGALLRRSSVGAVAKAAPKLEAKLVGPLGALGLPAVANHVIAGKPVFGDVPVMPVIPPRLLPGAKPKSGSPTAVGGLTLSQAAPVAPPPPPALPVPVLGKTTTGLVTLATPKKKSTKNPSLYPDDIPSPFKEIPHPNLAVDLDPPESWKLRDDGLPGFFLAPPLALPDGTLTLAPPNGWPDFSKVNPDNYYEVYAAFVDASVLQNKWTRTQTPVPDEGMPALFALPELLRLITGDLLGKDLNKAVETLNPFTKANVRETPALTNPVVLNGACKILHFHLIPAVEKVRGQMRVLITLCHTFKVARYSKRGSLVILGVMLFETVKQKFFSPSKIAE